MVPVNGHLQNLDCGMDHELVCGLDCGLDYAYSFTCKKSFLCHYYVKISKHAEVYTYSYVSGY